MESNTNLQIKQTETALKEIDNEISSLIRNPSTGLIGTVKRAKLVSRIDSLFEDKEFLDAVLKLKNKEFGFRTDEKSGENYPIEKIKSCVVQALFQGAELVGNEFNIIGGNCYLTKNFCENFLIKNKINYDIKFELSKKVDNIWVVPVKIKFYDFDNNLHEMHEDILVNKFSNTSESTVRGQAERDAMSLIIKKIKNAPVPIDKTSDFLEIKNQPFSTQQSEVFAESKNSNIQEADIISEADKNASENQENENSSTEQSQMVSKEIQDSFNSYISNTSKVKDLKSLLDRSKIFCTENNITSKNLDLTVFNSLKDKFTNNQN